MQDHPVDQIESSVLTHLLHSKPQAEQNDVFSKHSLIESESQQAKNLVVSQHSHVAESPNQTKYQLSGQITGSNQ